MYSQEESLKELKKPLRTSKGKILKKRGQVVYKTTKVPSFERNDTFKLKLDKNEEVTVFVRKNKPIKQVVHLSEEAYQAMIDKNAPYNYRDRKVPWSSMSKNQRIKWHCIQIAEQLGGVFESFQVM